MKYFKALDLILHTLLPLLLGCILYWFASSGILPLFIQNHLADGLWAYAFLSCMLIIWDRKCKYHWIVLAIILSVLFELFQYFHLAAGTGDIWDVFVYLLFFLLALLINQNPFYTRFYERS